MMDTKTMFESRWQRWVLTACVMLVLFAIGVQAVHVHGKGEPSGATCLACVSAHTGAPVATIVSPVMLIALMLVLILHEFEVPSYEACLPLFIRPPPTR
jgi:hypothetical protein